MAKGKRGGGGGRRKKQGDDSDNSDDSGEERKGGTGTHHSDEGDNNNNNNNNMDFRQRRDLQRQAAAEKRRSKQKCYLCGKTGHVRRECPGIADDGRGESKYSKESVKGGKASRRNNKHQHPHDYLRHHSSSTTTTTELPFDINHPLLQQDLPPGFAKIEEEQKNDDNDDDPVTAAGTTTTTTTTKAGTPAPPEDSATTTDEPSSLSSSTMDGDFLFYDAGCDILATIDYLRSGGRGGAKNNVLKQQDAIAEYQRAIHATSTALNFGGMISRSIIKPGRTWTVTGASPLLDDTNDSNNNNNNNNEDKDDSEGDGDGEDNNNNNNNNNNINQGSPFPHQWFVIGLSHSFLYNDTDHIAAVTSLVDTISNHPQTVVGVFADLDYTEGVLKKPGYDKESQLRRLRTTCQAAQQANVTIQIRTFPGGGGSSSSDTTTKVLYGQVLLDLEQVLLESISTFPMLQVHLSCWSGKAEHLLTLLKIHNNNNNNGETRRRNNIYVGIDGSVSFSKATHLHECAFDVPLDRLVLETGTPQTIPANVTKLQGRHSFNHAGLIPTVAETIAKYKRGKAPVPNAPPSAKHVAEMATANTLELYPQLRQQQQQQ